MSSSIPIYIANQHALAEVAGTKDAVLMQKISAAGSDRAYSIPQGLPTIELLNTIIGRPPLRRAMKNILYARRTSSPKPEYYLCTYELLCAHFSYGFFQNWIQISGASGWITRVQEASEAIGVNLDFQQLVFGGCLTDVPLSGLDEGGCGHWTAEQVGSYKQQVDLYLASDLCESQEDPMRALNYPLHDVSQWLNAASAYKDGAVVGFYL